MVFSSTVFLFIFLPILLGIYFAFKDKYANYVLLIGSLFFYAWGEPKNILLMLAAIVVNYVIGIGIDKYRKYSKLLLIVSLVYNLGVLFVFKYLNFTVDTVNDWFALDVNIEEIALPIGISFFTFQIISYVVDVYREKVKAQYDIVKLALYIALFPQLIAGPIVRYIDIEKQIDHREITINKFYDGVMRFSIGFSKKILIADQLATLVDFYFTGVYPSIYSYWIVIIAYSMQMYFDFSGYSDMAIGLGKMFGFNFMENFNHPFTAKSVQEFWRRWHISLVSWFMDYLYIPLGGSRKGNIRTYFNMFVVFFFTGLWHGANFTFISWGIFNVIFLSIERLGFINILNKLPDFVRNFYTLLILWIGTVFFRSDNMSFAISYLKGMFIPSGNDWINFIFIMDNHYWFCLVMGAFFSMPHNKILSFTKYNKYTEFVYSLLILIIFFIAIAYMVGSGYSPFLYFKF